MMLSSRRSTALLTGTVHLEALFDDLGNRQPRAQAAERVLEDDLHFPPQRAQGARLQPLDEGFAEMNGAARGDEAQQRQTQGGLAGAGFTDHPDRLAGLHVEGQAVHRLDVIDGATQQAGANGIPDPQVLGPYQGRSRRRGRRRAARLRLNQPLRVGVGGSLENRAGGAGFDDLAVLHDADAVGHLAHDGQIVGDEQHRHVEPALQAV